MPNSEPIRPDVAVLTTTTEEPAARTLILALEREGWRVVTGSLCAACAVVVWSQTNVDSQELTAQAEEYLKRDRLLQVLLQPEGWGYGKTGQIEPPEPFRYYQGLEVPHRDLDGSERAVDWFDFQPGEGQKLLAEIARLGSLARPRDNWNAKMTFYKPQNRSRTREVWLCEYTPGEERLLRRHKVGKAWPWEEIFETTIGNLWRIVDARTGEVLEKLRVDVEKKAIYLPKAESWWNRISRG